MHHCRVWEVLLGGTSLYQHTQPQKRQGREQGSTRQQHQKAVLAQHLGTPQTIPVWERHTAQPLPGTPCPTRHPMSLPARCAPSSSPRPTWRRLPQLQAAYRPGWMWVDLRLAALSSTQGSRTGVFLPSA